MMGEDGDHNTGGLVATGMRILNAIPAVCASPPGVLSTLDLPLVTGRGLLS
jgi:4-hydroxy-tetrahydrodipicolinate reductase